MKKLNKKDLSLNPRLISDLNDGRIHRGVTNETCQTNCAQATCFDYSKDGGNCDETFATKCLCGGNSKNCGETIGCGTKSGGALCCDSGTTCDNCGVLSQGNNCESKDYIKCDETVETCFKTANCDTIFQDCVMTKDNDGVISECACPISFEPAGCPLLTKNAKCKDN